MKKRTQLWLGTLVIASAMAARAQQLLPAIFAPATMPENGALALKSFRESDVKFRIQDLMDLLRDHQHEGWVLAAYPDPNTHRPLIGAGFSLDVQAVAHPQTDPFNPHTFVEPSSAQLWQAAGLPPEKLDRILGQFDRNMSVWSMKTYRRKIVRHTLPAELTEEEATRLLRISVIQAVYNARAYCSGFDNLTPSQQMAMSQLVFQMGTNLQAFVQFLDAVNDENNAHELAKLDGFMETPEQHWQRVQGALVDSQWARRYSVRASSVIAMFDPNYSLQPARAQVEVAAAIPAKPHAAAKVRAVSYRKRTRRHTRTSAKPSTT